MLNFFLKSSSLLVESNKFVNTLLLSLVRIILTNSSAILFCKQETSVSETFAWFKAIVIACSFVIGCPTSSVVCSCWIRFWWDWFL